MNSRQTNYITNNEPPPPYTSAYMHPTAPPYPTQNPVQLQPQITPFPVTTTATAGTKKVSGLGTKVCLIKTFMIGAVVVAVVVGVVVAVMFILNRNSNNTTGSTDETTTLPPITGPVTNGTTKINSYISWQNTVCDYGYVFNGTHCEECGTSDVQPNVKIVGGVNANAYSWPAQALIVIQYKTVYNNKVLSFKFECGGTVINRYTILTAAHCILDSSIPYSNNGQTVNIEVKPNTYYSTFESMYKIYVGVQNIGFIATDSTPAPPGMTLKVSKIIKHPNYSDMTNNNDIALLKLTSPAEFSSYIKPACLPPYKSTSYPGINIYCYAAGWGTKTEDGSISYILQNVKLTVYDVSKCSKVISDSSLSSSQICAGEYNGGKDTCQGDSGGGLYTIDTNSNKQRYVVTGITSYGNGCARYGMPGVYTRTSNYLDWIIANF